MKYLVMIFEIPAERQPPRQDMAADGRRGEFENAARQAGVLVESGLLQPPHAATVLSLGEGGLDVSDGTFTGDLTALSGIVVLECPDLDSAIEWVARIPALRYSAVELRPFKDAGV